MFDQLEAERVVRRPKPELSEAPVAVARRLRTPVDKFYRRNHFPDVPQLGSDWSLGIEGLVSRPRRLTREQLMELPRSSVTTVLECAGNGGVTGHLKRGGFGIALWEGVMVKDILECVEVNPTARFMDVKGLDSGKDPDESLDVDTYLRSIPLDVVLDRVLLATHMNGVELPPDHGYPARLVVPGWYGSDWIKWVDSFALTAAPAKCVYMDDRYRRFQYEDARSFGPEVRTVQVKSMLGQPVADEICTGGRVELTGLAWTGSGAILQVDARVDHEEWTTMVIVERANEGGVVRWAGEFSGLAPGMHTVSTRARDDVGNIQPEQPHGRMYEANHVLSTPIYCV